MTALGRFDRFLVEQTAVGQGQWSLVTLDDLHTYLAECGRHRLTPAKEFLHWLRSRKGVPHALAQALPDRPRQMRLRVLPAGQAAALYRCWTAEDADPPAALVGLLALLHCLNNGQIRYLRLADVSDGGTHLRVGTRVVPLAPPVVHALARYLAFRERTYGGPSTYLLVSRLSRLHDRPVSRSWFQANVLGGIAVASLRQTAIQHLIQGPACDGLQLAAYTSLSLERVGIYMRVFGAPAPWPPSTKGVSGSA